MSRVIHGIVIIFYYIYSLHFAIILFTVLSRPCSFLLQTFHELGLYFCGSSSRSGDTMLDDIDIHSQEKVTLGDEGMRLPNH